MHQPFCASVTYHLVGKDAVDAVFVEWDHPVESTHLIVPHLSAFYICNTHNSLNLHLFTACTGSLHRGQHVLLSWWWLACCNGFID